MAETPQELSVFSKFLAPGSTTGWQPRGQPV